MFTEPMSVLFLFFIYLQISSAVIYNLNETEYMKLPPIFLLDPYEECMQNPDGLFCATEVVLVSDNQSLLLDVIQEYSAHSPTHYNHSFIYYNLCMTTTCNEYYDDTTTDLASSLEACLNKTFQDRYGLKTRVLDNIHCKKSSEKIKVEVADLCMFALLTGILMLNIIGSLYDFLWTNGHSEEGIRFWTYFALRRNWRKLVAPALEGPELRLKRLKVLSALKCISTMMVIAVHATISLAIFIENPHYVEELFKSFAMQLLVNGAVIVQTFFIMSGFLLAYNLELLSEKQNFTINWMLLPKGIALRWIRLTPVYALLLFFTVTCNKYLVDGPLWHNVVMAEAEDCKQYWWQHLLYINNYNDKSQCLLQTWYLASDTQLYCLGLVIYIACRSSVSRKVVIPLLLVVSLAIPVGHTYWQDLDGTFVATPENFRHYLLDNRTFNYLYKRGHTNMFSYLAGMSAAFLAYYGQKINYNVQKLRKYRILYYAMVPLGAGLLMSGSVFYRDGPRPSMAVRMLFAAYQKPVWCLLIGTGMLGVIFKYEGFFRGIAEWHGWTALSRLSYCAYLVHLTIITQLRALGTSLERSSVLAGTESVVFSVVVSYLVALPCWLLVEQPFGQLMKMFLPSPKKESTEAINGAKGTMELMNGDKNINEEQLTRV